MSSTALSMLQRGFVGSVRGARGPRDVDGLCRARGERDRSWELSLLGTDLFERDMCFGAARFLDLVIRAMDRWS